MTARGFTLIELLVALAIVLVIFAGIAAFAAPMRDAFNRSVSAGELAARSRAGLEMLTAEVRDAGAGLIVGSEMHAIGDAVPIVIPLRSLSDRRPLEPYEALMVTYALASGGQALLVDRAPAGSTTLSMDRALPCPREDGTCGFVAGNSVMILDAARSESGLVRTVNPAASMLVLSAPILTSFERGATVMAIERTTYGVRSLPDGSSRLVRITQRGAEEPVVDSVAAFEISIAGLAAPPLPGARPEDYPTYGPMPPPIGIDDLRDMWPAGENCTLTLDGSGARASRLEELGERSALLSLSGAMLADGPWCADATDVERFDADLLRARRVDIRLRVEAASADLRGPAGVLFTRAGRATRAARWLPDIELRASVALRSR